MRGPNDENRTDAALGLADSLLESTLRELEHHRKKTKGKSTMPILALRLGAALTAYVRQLAGAQTVLAQLEVAELGNGRDPGGDWTLEGEGDVEGDVEGDDDDQVDDDEEDGDGAEANP